MSYEFFEDFSFHDEAGKPGNIMLRLFYGKYESAVFKVRPVFTKRKAYGMNSDYKKSCVTINTNKGISK